ncbi:alpha/beta fold hydrolase [Candidatus Daviesbacteria bacterium]|nr:alpha/beta fold hydrolase [Candidatus Daviesbacteria bacterium]
MKVLSGILILGAVVIFILVALIIGKSLYTSKSSSSNLPVNSHPLMIEEMRKKHYEGGAIDLVEKVGDYDGFKSYIIAYPSENLRLFALMNVPTREVPEGGFPIIILNHGFISPRSYSTINSYKDDAKFYAQNGFVVIKPDYRGHDNSEGRDESGHYSPYYTYDVLNLVASIKKLALKTQSSPLTLINPEKIGMWGHSMGGQITLRSLVISSDIKAAVLFAGVVASAYDLYYSWPERFTKPIWASDSGRQRLPQEFGTPKENPLFWDKVSAINYVDFVTAPIQIHHGEKDQVVPIEFSEKLLKILQEKGKQVEFFRYPGDDHGLSNNHDLFLQRTLEFFKVSL